MQIPAGKITLKSSVRRCSWATTDLLIGYHDREWGVPVHEDRVLFEFLILEGMQAGLSWETVLTKRENYRGWIFVGTTIWSAASAITPKRSRGWRRFIRLIRG